MKKVFYVGCIIGALLGLVVSLSMDLMLGKSLGGGWSEAMARDLNGLFHASMSPNHIVVILGVVVVIGIISGFGAIIGGIFSVMIARLFSMLTKGS